MMGWAVSGPCDGHVHPGDRIISFGSWLCARPWPCAPGAHLVLLGSEGGATPQRRYRGRPTSLVFAKFATLIDSADLAAAKAAARRTARAVRDGLDAAVAGAALVAHWPPAWTAQTPISAYWPMRNEIDPRPLLTHLHGQGLTLLLPRMFSRSAPPLFHVWKPGDRLAEDACGIPAPTLSAPILEPRLLLVPLLAFDRMGGRLGYGGGHYDRLIAGLRPGGGRAVGLAFAGQEIAAVPRGPLDQMLDAVLTDQGLISVG
jgi:5-formyltetrahydrofolate cyclo-ligase